MTNVEDIAKSWEDIETLGNPVCALLSFGPYIKKVVRQVHPGTTLTPGGLRVIDDCLIESFHQISSLAAKLHTFAGSLLEVDQPNECLNIIACRGDWVLLDSEAGASWETRADVARAGHDVAAFEALPRSTCDETYDEWMERMREYGEEGEPHDPAELTCRDIQTAVRLGLHGELNILHWVFIRLMRYSLAS